MLDFKNCELN